MRNLKLQKNLYDLIMNGNIEEIKSFLQKNPDLINSTDENGVSAVLFCYYIQKPEIGDYLIKIGANVGIFEASVAGKTEQLKNILKENPDSINSYSADGFQALGFACFFGQTDAARILIKSGAPINNYSQNELKVMPLHSAAASQNLEIARMLIENGADVDAVQNGGFTALHTAAHNGQIEMIKLLVTAGANPKRKNNKNKTPEDLARENGHIKVVEYLNQYCRTNIISEDSTYRM